MEYYLGIAVIPGVKVTLSSECGLLKIPLTAQSTLGNPKSVMASKAELQQMVAQYGYVPNGSHPSAWATRQEAPYDGGFS